MILRLVCGLESEIHLTVGPCQMCATHKKRINRLHAKSENRRGDSNYIKCLWILSPEMTSLIRVGFPICMQSSCILLLPVKNVTRVNTYSSLLSTPHPFPLRPYSTSTADDSLHALYCDEPITVRGFLQKRFADEMD